MQQGRRTASLKASYEAINTGVHAHELSIGRELAGAAHTALQATQEAARKHKYMFFLIFRLPSLFCQSVTLNTIFVNF